ncbi:MAG: hypothetical protein DDT24_00761 [Chloroflexi bacterium]|nr:hypothetical protein [Chloroflexota bacterium]
MLSQISCGKEFSIGLMSPSKAIWPTRGEQASGQGFCDSSLVDSELLPVSAFISPT